jgi:N-acetylglucosaminyl-diphospho-decaprenol L-rhamnosyltransferase
LETEILLSIIIVNWRVPELLRACLASIYRETKIHPTLFEIIVVDNNSGDHSVELVRAEFPQVVCIANEVNVGFGRANNQAYQKSRGRFVLLLNPDTLIQHDAIGQTLALMQQRPPVVALGCRLLNGDGSFQRWTGGRFPSLWNVACHYLFLSRLLARLGHHVSVYLTYDVAHDCEVDWLCGAFLMLRRDAIPDPLFDPSYFMYGEDMDVCYRLKQAGGTILYTPAASIIHYQGASMSKQQGDILLTSLKGVRMFYRKTHGSGKLWLFDSLTVAGFGLRWCAYSIGARFSGNASFTAKAASSHQYLTIALQLIKSRKE